MTVLLDAGPLVALLNRRDAHHDWAVRRARQLEAPLSTCEAALSEAHFLLQDVPDGREKLIALSSSDRIRCSFSYADHAERVNDLMRTYADVPMSFADACLVRMAELRANGRVFTTDSDFRIYQKHGDAPIPVLMPG